MDVKKNKALDRRLQRIPTGIPCWYIFTSWIRYNWSPRYNWNIIESGFKYHTFFSKSITNRCFRSSKSSEACHGFAWYFVVRTDTIYRWGFHEINKMSLIIYCAFGIFFFYLLQAKSLRSKKKAQVVAATLQWLITTIYSLSSAILYVSAPIIYEATSFMITGLYLQSNRT